MASRPSAILSGGGIGSTVVASRYRRDGPVRWVFVDYGQPAAEQERQAVIAIANASDAPDVTTVRVDHLAQLAQRPVGTRAGSTNDPRNGEPLRDFANAGLLGTLVGIGCDCALRVNATGLMIGLYGSPSGGGLTASDGPGWQLHPREFVHAANIFAEATFPVSKTPEILAPVVELPAADVVRFGCRFDAPLDLTWSCYFGGETHCRRCAGCVQRFDAFAEAGTDTKTAAPTR
ncbi:MAG: 7-cyano-7-deazaguanine synthase [Planctomycetes bacterium]|nr:7-cyano-7-deazaguanine synthase [Planctomycetota bacterium]